MAPGSSPCSRSPGTWSAGYNIVEPGDLNGDGKADVGLYRGTTGAFNTGISNGLGGFAYICPTRCPRGTPSCGCAISPAMERPISSCTTAIPARRRSE